jgi:hypothetical protein
MWLMSLMIPHFTAPSPRHGTGLFTSIALEPGAFSGVSNRR